MKELIQHNTLPKGCTTPGELSAQDHACTSRVSLTPHDVELAEADLAKLRSLGPPEWDLAKAVDHATTHHPERL